MESSSNFNNDMSIEITILKENNEIKKILHLYELEQEIDKLVEDLEEWFLNDEDS